MVAESPYYRATSNDIDWVAKVRMQGRVQKWVDHSISVTVNLPADVTEDVRRTLAELHNRGYKLALGSSSKNAKFILEKVQLLDAFDAISDGTNITKSKPDPEVFLRAAEFLGEKPEDCYVVEDAYAGIDAAKSAGMQAVGIGIAAGYAAADVKIQSFGELLTLGA